MSAAHGEEPRAVLWDLDGTLVDSGDYHWRSWRDTLAAEGHPLTYQQFLDSFGQRNDRILAGWLGEEAPTSVITRIGDAKEALYREFARREGLIALPGAAQWVEKLHDAGWLEAIASSAPRANVEVMLEAVAIAQYFQAVVAAEDVSIGKPDPQVFLTAAARLGVSPSRCIVVEDAAAGIEAARAGGMRAIGVSATGELAADLFVRSLADLAPDAFDRLLG
jgi:beta-phosphoglucomutase